MERTVDKEIRPFLKEHLHTLYGDVPIYEELAIAYNSTVVDMVVLAQGELIGLEIKSGKDNLRRLPTQIKNYDKVFSRNYIVVDDNHLEKVERMVPHYWGIILAYHDGTGDVFIELYRDAEENPNQDAYWVLELLWRDELTYLMKKHEIYRGMSKARMVERRRKLLLHLSLYDTVQEVIHLLPQRDGWKSNKEEEVYE